MSVLKNVGVELIDANPFRCLDEYPWNESKIDALMRSIADVGFWEGVIVRKIGKRYQMAFGHHRLEAAVRSSLTWIPVIERELTDEQMLQFMGRENGEDYSTDFLTMLNTWEAAIQFRTSGNKSQPVDLARILGWVRNDGKMNDIANACSAAHRLIVNDYINRVDLSGLGVHQALRIVDRAASRMGQLDKAGKDFNRPKKEIETAKKQVAKAAVITAENARKGKVATSELRGEVDVQAHKVAARSKTKQSPLFGVFGKALADGIEKMLHTDSAATKLQNIVDALNNLTMEEDAATVRRVDFQLGELSKRADAWQKRLILEKVIRDRFPLLEGGKL